MADVYTEKVGLGSRLKESIKGVLVGVLFFLVSFPLLWWNEGRAVQTAEALGEGKSEVIPVAADPVNASNDGKLVHVSGAVYVKEPLRDPVFAVSAEALRMVRVVETYQWIESTKTEGATTTYTYEKKWSERLVDSSQFKQKADHANPTTMAYDAKDMIAIDAKLGGFAFPEEAIKRLAKFEDVAVDEAARAKLSPEIANRSQIVEGKLFLGKSPKEPMIGDVRVAFRIIKPQIVSIIAQQKNGSFAVFPTKAGDGLMRVDEGALDATKMFADAGAQNDTLTWILRGLGFVLMALGLSLVLRPIAAAVSFIPKIGSLVGFSAVVFSVVVSAGLSGVTIAIAWIAHRPLLGIAVLLGGTAALAIAIVMSRVGKRKARA